MIVRAIRWIMICTLFGSIFGICAVQGQQSKKAPVPASSVPSGVELYQKHCEPCHGSDLKGNGPFPPPYRMPPDLTTLARRHGGKFPDAYVANVLSNGVTLPPHGPAEMPVWGTEFAAAAGLDKNQVTSRIKNLVTYIKSHQTK